MHSQFKLAVLQYMNRRSSAVFVLAIFLVFSPYFFYSFGAKIVSAAPAFTRQINYQGKLTNSSNVAVADGNYNMEFKLYAASTGGTAIWTETRTSSDRVSVTSGLFSAMLGSVTSLSGVDFNQTLYLSINIGGTGDSASWDGEMTPRKTLGAVPAAFMSQGLEAANPITVASSSTTTLVTITQSGTGRLLDLISGGNTIFTGLVSGYFGIGTTTPQASLQIATSSGPQLFLTDPSGGTNLKHWFASSTLGALTFGAFSDDYTTRTERLRIDSSGRLGIGTTSPSQLLSIHGNALISGTTTLSNIVATGTLTFNSTGNLNYTGRSTTTLSGVTNALSFASSTNAVTPIFTLDAANTRAAFNTNSSVFTVSGVSIGTGLIVSAQDTNNLGNIAAVRYETGSYPAYFIGAKARGTESSPSAVQDGDDIASFTALGHDGTDFGDMARILVEADGTTGNNDLPARIVFMTSPDGSISPVEAMRINNAGNIIAAQGIYATGTIQATGNSIFYGTLGIGTTSPAANNALAVHGNAYFAGTTTVHNIVATGTIKLLGSQGRTITNASEAKLIQSLGTTTLDFSQPILGLVSYEPIIIFEQPNTSIGAGAFFNYQPTIQNAAAEANSIGNHFGFIDQATLRADTQQIGSSVYRSFISQPIFGVVNDGALTFGEAINYMARTIISSGATIVNRYGLYVEDPGGTILSNGAITNNYGIYLDEMNFATGTNYAIYSLGGPSYFQGQIGIGTTSPWGQFSIEQLNGSNATTSTLFVVADQGTSTPHFIVTGRGFTGLGTTTPTEQLSLSQRLYVGGSGTSTIENNLRVLGTLQVGAGTTYITNTGVGFADGAALNTSGSNFGFGTTSPSQILSIHGNALISGNLTSVANITATGTLGVSGLSTFAGYISTASSSVANSLKVSGELWASSTLQSTGNILGYGSLGVGTTSPATSLSTAGSTYLGDALTDTLTIHSGVINYPIAATTTIIDGNENMLAWATSTSASSRIVMGTTGGGAYCFGVGTDIIGLYDEGKLGFCNNSGSVASVSNYNILQVGNSNPALLSYVLARGSIAGIILDETDSTVNNSFFMELNASSTNFKFTNSVASYVLLTMNAKTNTSGFANATATATPWGVLSVENGDNNNQPTFVAADSSGDATPFVIDSAGNVGIGSTTPGRALSVEGQVNMADLTTGTNNRSICWSTTNNILMAVDAACTTSSERFKRDITLMTYGLDEVMKLRPVEFYYKPEADVDQTHKIGLIAEEVVPIIPELGVYDNDNVLFGIDYPKLTALLIKAIQEQQEQIESLTAQSGMLSLSDIRRDVNFNNLVLHNVNAIYNYSGNWSIDANGKLIVKEIESGSVKTNKLEIGSYDKRSGITLYDEATGEPYCLKIKNGAMVSVSGKCGEESENEEIPASNDGANDEDTTSNESVSENNDASAADEEQSNEDENAGSDESENTGDNNTANNENTGNDGDEIQNNNEESDDVIESAQ